METDLDCLFDKPPAKGKRMRISENALTELLDHIKAFPCNECGKEDIIIGSEFCDVDGICLHDIAKWREELARLALAIVLS